jgi:CIC family chloride channel protein
LVFEGNYHEVISDSVFSELPESTLLLVVFFMVLVLFKVIATVITIGAGGIGGIFAPSLFSGAITGFLIAFLINRSGLNIQLSEMNYSLVGMGSVLGGVLHAPLTGIFLIAEITSGYELIVPLMISTTISYVTVKFLTPDSIFTKQLANRGELITHNKDKAVLRFLDLTEVIEYDLKTVPVTATLGDLVQVIAQSSRNIYPVVDKDKHLCGIIQLDHVREIMFNPSLYDQTLVRSLMIPPPALIFASDHMEEVMEKFQETNAWNLPVTDEGKYVGFISKSKVFSVYRQQLLKITED